MTPRYLPSTISVMDIGALNSSVRVFARRSSEMRRMVSSGTTSSSRKAASVRKFGRMIRVAPGQPSISAYLSWFGPYTTIRM